MAFEAMPVFSPLVRRLARWVPIEKTTKSNDAKIMSGLPGVRVIAFSYKHHTLRDMGYRRLSV